MLIKSPMTRRRIISVNENEKKKQEIVKFVKRVKNCNRYNCKRRIELEKKQKMKQNKKKNEIKK